MKKLLFIILSLLLILGMVECSKDDNYDNDQNVNSDGNNYDVTDNNKTYTFRGKIVEMYMDNLIVEPLENEEIRRSSDRIKVWFGQNPEFHPPIFPEGTLVEIEFDGNIDETYPAQINAINLRTIDENGNDIIPLEESQTENT